MGKNYWQRDGEYQVLRAFVREVEEPEGYRSRMISQALREELTPRQREMLHLYYAKQMPMKLIARELGLNPSTVSRTLKRAREKLERCLRYCGADLRA